MATICFLATAVPERAAMSSEPLGFLRRAPLIALAMFASDMPGVRSSGASLISASVKRQVRSLPSLVIRIRLQVLQK